MSLLHTRADCFLCTIVLRHGLPESIRYNVLRGIRRYIRFCILPFMPLVLFNDGLRVYLIQNASHTSIIYMQTCHYVFGVIRAARCMTEDYACETKKTKTLLTC